MIRTISKAIFSILLFFDKLLILFFKRSFLIWFSEFSKSERSLHGLNFFVTNPTIDWRIKKMFEKEPETIEWINNFDNDITFWDIGGNIGLYSLYCAKMQTKSKIVCFEPSTSNLRVLSRNIFLNNFQSRIKIFQLPLSNEKFGFSLMTEGEFQEGGASNSFGVDYDFEGKSIETLNEYQLIGTSIDFLTENGYLQTPNYIKIDVDGIEHLILDGARETLKSFEIKEILVELNEDFKEQYDNCIKILFDSGFKIKSKHEAKSPIKSNANRMFNYIFVRQ